MSTVVVGRLEENRNLLRVKEFNLKLDANNQPTNITSLPLDFGWKLESKLLHVFCMSGVLLRYPIRSKKNPFVSLSSNALQGSVFSRPTIYFLGYPPSPSTQIPEGQMDSLLSIISSQRERFRARNHELEAVRFIRTKGDFRPRGLDLQVAGISWFHF